MGKHLMRAGGAMLAALTIAAGGMAMGAGTAGAITGPGSLDPICSVGGDLPQPCTDESFMSEVMVGDTYLTYGGTDRAAPGDETTFYAAFYLGKPIISDLPDGPLPDAVISSVTHHTPSGFEFTGAKAYAYSHSRATLLDSTVVVDPVTGDVTVTAPDGGWAIPKDRDNYGDNGRIHVALNYTVTKVEDDSTSWMTFTGTDAPASGGWVATGDTQAHSKSLVGWLGSSIPKRYGS